MKDKHAKTIMVEEKQIGDCHILVTEYLAIKEAIVTVIQKNFQMIIVESNSQLMVINWELLVEDIRMLSYLFKDISISYCHGISNRTDRIAKSTHV